ncbi:MULTISPECIES: monooxygenase [unclassified Roseitalea]|uniref:monooxygenase n=1 Tax=unclassified Roseitalea TaxID=2639107 RepID=UPI00273E1566|nr:MULTISPECIES: monooxygenase [unclassified Roseitalea]
MAITLVQVDFPHQGPWGDEMAQAMEGLAQSIAAEPGFVFKYWTENRDQGRAGGVYGFAGRPEAEAYLAMHSERLKGFGYSDIRGMIFEVNETLSRIDNAPVL